VSILDVGIRRIEVTPAVVSYEYDERFPGTERGIVRLDATTGELLHAPQPSLISRPMSAAVHKVRSLWRETGTWPEKAQHVS
jgi:hypothetical protein